MNSQDFKLIERWFDTYVTPYLEMDAEISGSVRLKLDHTHRVVEEMELLTASLELPEDDCLLARAVALLHDAGRFEQIALYRTMNDSESVNHSQLCLRELERYNVLDHLKDEEKDIITGAIDAHNRMIIPEEFDRRNRLFSRLIRDADKLDIWRVVIGLDSKEDNTTRDKIFFNLPEEGSYSQEILDSVIAGKMVNNKNARSRNDIRLLVMAWVFDLNFAVSKREVLKRGYIDSLAELLPDDTGIGKVVNTVKEFLENTDR